MRTLFVVLVFVTFTAMAQEKIFLYPGNKEADAPFIESFPAKKPNGTTILVCPGGGYTHLAVDHEGKDVAKFYNQHGFDAWVLHYRVNQEGKAEHHFPEQLDDVTTAIRIVKSKAKDGEKVGIIGFSAGGHLTSMCATMHVPADKSSSDPVKKWSSRPAFAMLIYPVIDMNTEIAHKGSRANLLGKNPDVKLADSLSTQNRVTAQTPPTFIIYSTDDDVVMVENGLRFYEALHKHNVPATIHVFDHGGHGYGLAPKDPVIKVWPELSVKWIEGLGLK